MNKESSTQFSKVVSFNMVKAKNKNLFDLCKKNFTVLIHPIHPQKTLKSLKILAIPLSSIIGL